MFLYSFLLHLKLTKQWNFANQLLYNPALTMVKVSILLFLRRLESKSRLVNSLIWGTMAVTVGLFLAVLFVDLFQCWPVAYVYDKSIAHGKCIQQGAFYVATAALNLFTDLLVLSIPIIITWSLHMPLRRKLAVCLILCLGGVYVPAFPRFRRFQLTDTGPRPSASGASSSSPKPSSPTPTTRTRTRPTASASAAPRLRSTSP